MVSSLYALAAYGAGADLHTANILLGHHMDLSQVSTLRGHLDVLCQGPKPRRRPLQKRGLD